MPPKRGRIPKFKPRLAGDVEMAHWEAAARLYGDAVNSATRIRVVREFVSFHYMNGLDLLDSLYLWVGTMRFQTMEWGTIDTYSSYVTRAVWPDLPPESRTGWRAARKIIRCAHADADTKSAVTIDSQSVLALLPLLSGRTRQAIASIAFTGARLSDIKRWRRKQFNYRAKSLSVQVRLSKNRRSRAMRRILRMHNFKLVLGLPIDQSLLDMMTEAILPDDRPFAACTVTALNATIRQICVARQWPVWTTYSFRKFFIRSISAHLNFDWERIIRFTLHCGIDVVAAHYDIETKELEDEANL